MNTKQWFALGVTTVAVIAIGVYTTGHTTPVEALVTNDNALLLQDQPPSDETVVAYAKLEQPGYVVIYTTTTTTETKTVLGQSDLLSAGEHRNVHVHHNNNTKPTDGSTIFGAIVADDGDGTFSDTDDTEILLPEDESTTADISDDAVIDTSLTDEELASELTNAGYDVNEDAVDEDTTANTTQDTSSQDVETEPSENQNDNSVEDTSTTSSDDDMSTDSQETSSSTVELEVQ